MPRGECRLAAAGIARLFEEPRRNEIREQIGRRCPASSRLFTMPCFFIAAHMSGAWFHIRLAITAGV